MKNTGEGLDRNSLQEGATASLITKDQGKRHQFPSISYSHKRLGQPYHSPYAFIVRHAGYVYKK